MADATPGVGYGTLTMLLVVMAISVWLGSRAQRAVEKGGFVKGYFLGNRGLGAWALALTATVQSGGTFMGFPALVYTHGWIVALWIAGYMVVPITGFAVLGKRFAQLSRRPRWPALCHPARGQIHGCQRSSRRNPCARAVAARRRFRG